MSVKRALTLLFLAKSAFAGYSAVASISVSHTRAGTADLTNFPLLVAGTYPKMASVANGGLVTSSSGFDVVFSSDSGCTAKMNWQTEYWDATGKVAYWVVIPTLSHTNDNTLFVCVGNSAITTNQSNASAVWDRTFVGVWHLPNGTTLNVNDSTSNANNGTAVTATATSGIVDGAANFNGSQNVVIPDTASLQLTTFTIETWVYVASLNGQYAEIVRKGTPWYLFISNGNSLGLAINDDYNAAPVYSMNAGWTHIVATYDGTSVVNIYANGSLVSSRTTGAIALDSTNIYLGSTETALQYLTGKLDELRISNVVRSANWIAADYANQSAPQIFYSLSFPVPGAIATGSPILW